MPLLETLLSHEALLRLGATLLHFVWQGTAIAAAAAVAFRLLGRSSASARYVVGCLALVAMLAAPMGTFIVLLRGEPPAAFVAEPPVAAFIAELAAPDAVGLSGSSPAAAALSRAAADHLSMIAPLAVGMWMVGVAMLVVRHLVGVAQVSRLRRRALPAEDAVLLSRLSRLAERMHVARPIALLISGHLDAPAVVGVIRPAILWPAAALSGLTPLQLDALLAHELGHVRRHDYLVNLLQVLIETLLFYHPAVWWLSARVRQEREHCCDDAATAAIDDRVGYAEALVAMETRRHLTSQLVLGIGGASLARRVRRILSPAGSARVGPLAIAGVAAALVLLVVLIAFAFRGDEKPAASPLATQPTTSVADYRITAGDLLQVTVFELEGGGKQTVLLKRVANTGWITLPYLSQFTIAGMTEADVEQKIGQAYVKAGVLSHYPVVNVLIIEQSDGRKIPPALLTPPTPAPVLPPK